MRKAVVILNAGSGVHGDEQALVDDIRGRFHWNDIRADIKLAKSGEELVKYAAEAAKSECELMVAGGGDGTISAVAEEAVKSNKTLGVLPLGTLNHFSKDLNIPQTLEDAVAAIAAGNVTEIDVGEVNGRIFLNNSSIGLYPRIVLSREKQQHKLGRGKWPAAFWATVTVLRRHPFLDVKLTVEGKTLKRRTPMVFIGNNDYEMEGFSIGRRPTLKEGKLSLYIIHQTGRWGLLKLAVRTLFGTLRQAEEFEELMVEECEIETRRRKALLVAFDGEVAAMPTPLEYKIRPRALKVIVKNEPE